MTKNHSVILSFLMLDDDWLLEYNFLLKFFRILIFGLKMSTQKTP